MTPGQILHMSFWIICSEVDLASWSDLAYNLVDLLLLGLRVIIVPHVQSLELSLPAEDSEQRAHALIGTFEPLALIDAETLQGVELVIGEGLKELGAI